ncbi:hypothetical protein Anacy_0665 [Anabaena cylindrica PCC 7122]|uniref:Uncharacterized protein n=2 Tax=Nostocaceae TaxID=1162 RepID=K9ZD27_ANACC|nr:hypothetical protein Anacy_0665 [Anabaena cylindrica PCC 7122]BAY01310.1 hypothetical protein NIES19_05400 [Anabaena cylindrica PCC 7122]
MSMLSTVMIARPIHAGQTVTPIGTHLSCVRSNHSATPRQVCIQVDNTTPSTAKPTMQLAQVEGEENQTIKNEPEQQNQPDELEFTEAESDEAIKLFGCDCPACISSVRQLHGLAPLPV